MQKGHLVAAILISLVQKSHALVIGSAGSGAFFVRATNELMGFTTKKKITAAKIINETIALMKSPTRKTLLFTVK